MNKSIAWMLCCIESQIQNHEYDNAADGLEAIATIYPDSSFADDAKQQARDLRSWGPFALGSASNLTSKAKDSLTV